LLQIFCSVLQQFFSLLLYLSGYQPALDCWQFHNRLQWITGSKGNYSEGEVATPRDYQSNVLHSKPANGSDKSLRKCPWTCRVAIWFL